MLGLTKFASLAETERMVEAKRKIEALLLSPSSKGNGGALGQISIVKEVRAWTSSVWNCCISFNNLIVFFSLIGPVCFRQLI